MDTVPTPELARRLGVSLSTAHLLADAAGVPRSGRGVARMVPITVADRIAAEHGAVPRREGLRRVRAMVLAALLRAPYGLASARRVAEVAGVSPTVAARELRELLALGIVSHDLRRVARGHAVDLREWRLVTTSAGWARVADAVRRVQLPEKTVTATATRLPARFGHHFWNSDPGSLILDRDGAYIARRLLTGSDGAAQQWALQNATETQLRAAVHGRGADARTRALVENWLAS